VTLTSRRYLTCCLLLAALWLFPPFPAGSETPRGRLLTGSERQALFDRLSEVQAGLTTFEAGFDELRSMAGLRRPLRYSGRLYFQRDGLFFMAYTRPIEYILHVRGKTALMYIKGNPSADRVVMDQDGGIAPQARWFDWDPAAFSGEIHLLPKRYRFSARPEGQPGIDLYLDRASLLVRRIVIFNEGGDTTDIVLSDIRTGHPLPETVTGFHLPEGVVVNTMDPP
jgi:outer membrane lipoprotein-sorting protein